MKTKTKRKMRAKSIYSKATEENYKRYSESALKNKFSDDLGYKDVKAQMDGFQKDKEQDLLILIGIYNAFTASYVENDVVNTHVDSLVDKIKYTQEYINMELKKEEIEQQKVIQKNQDRQHNDMIKLNDTTNNLSEKTNKLTRWLIILGGIATLSAVPQGLKALIELYPKLSFYLPFN